MKKHSTAAQRESQRENFLILRIKGALALMHQLKNAQGVAACENEIQKIKDKQNARSR